MRMHGTEEIAHWRGSLWDATPPLPLRASGQFVGFLSGATGWWDSESTLGKRLPHNREEFFRQRSVHMFFPLQNSGWSVTALPRLRDGDKEALCNRQVAAVPPKLQRRPWRTAMLSTVLAFACGCAFTSRNRNSWSYIKTADEDSEL